MSCPLSCPWRLQEHMFFSPERIDVMREMILADSTEARKQALERLFVFQKDDMRAIFSAMSGYAVRSDPILFP